MDFSNKEKTNLIMQHYSMPNNKIDKMNESLKYTYKHSKSCVDEIKLHLKIKNQVIIDANFYGVGCAVFLSSSDIFLDQIKNKNLNLANDIAQHYFNLINQKEIINKEILGNLNIFVNVKTHLNRLTCASLIYKAYRDFVKKII